ncbi:hypothetical protein GIB67_018725 [Kingdonia uniflora]|uniref:Uncharacterized protein n=1 Tax=Kingdonia uniflora TaxID=39325 RepID=A0A7J7L2D2_9MAGN|nr:hypothetical protein GIB67_018725 [Kingdonia uniflora]
MQLDLFRNMKDVLKWVVIITDNISRKRVLLQNPFGGYEWYLRDRCWAQLEHQAVPYDPPEKLHCFPSPDVARSLRAAGWIEAQDYIVGHHVDYDAYWRHVSHGVLMSDIARVPSFLIEYNYLDGKGVEVDWEDDEGEMGTSRGRGLGGWGLRGRTSQGGAAHPRRSRRTWGSFE